MTEFDEFDDDEFEGEFDFEEDEELFEELKQEPIDTSGIINCKTIKNQKYEC